MSHNLERNKQVVRTFVEQFKNRANLDIVDELMTGGFEHHFRDPRFPRGRDGTKAVGRAIFAAFPDVRVTIEDIFAEGDRVVERSVARGTHRGEFLGAPATDSEVTWTETHIYRLEDGRIAEHWPEVDLLGLMVQVGAIPGPA